MKMKKFIITLIAAVAGITSVSAMSPKEAFKALSNIPNVSLVTPDYNLPISSDTIPEGGLAAAYNLDQEQIKVTGNAAYTILNQVPLNYMVNGGNNNEVAAFIYAMPNVEGSNDVLVAAMSGYRGMVVFMLLSLDDAQVAAIQAAPLSIQGNFLNLEANLPGDNQFNILLNKAR